MLTEKFFEVISHEGVVSIISWGKGEPHVANTWNSYLTLTKDNKILIPAGVMVKTEANIKENNKVKMTLGSKEVQGHFTQGAGFRLEGTAKFISLGEEYDMMKEKFPFLTRVLEITLTEIEQTL